jgi:hypothetical protein
MVVAEKLGMTLSQLRQEMTLEELKLWDAFYELRRQQEEEARRKAKVGRR